MFKRFFVRTWTILHFADFNLARGSHARSSTLTRARSVTPSTSTTGLWACAPRRPLAPETCKFKQSIRNIFYNIHKTLCLFCSILVHCVCNYFIKPVEHIFDEIPGQSSSSQLWNSRAGPSQNFPPYSGTGLSHLRMRSCRPLPQVTEHGLHEVQPDQRPFTKEDNNWHVESLVTMHKIRSMEIAK